MKGQLTNKYEHKKIELSNNYTMNCHAEGMRAVKRTIENITGGILEDSACSVKSQLWKGDKPPGFTVVVEANGTKHELDFLYSDF